MARVLGLESGGSFVALGGGLAFSVDLTRSNNLLNCTQNNAQMSQRNLNNLLFTSGASTKTGPVYLLNCPASQNLT